MILEPEDGFNGVRQVIEGIWDNGLWHIQEYSRIENVVVRLYGEFFGPKIQGRVDYGPNKGFLIFDIEVDGFWLSPREVEDFLYDLKCDHLMVPVIAYAHSLEEALECNVNLNSMLTKAEGGTNIMEGGVIKPYELVIRTSEGSTFYLKKTNNEFSEKSTTKPWRQLDGSNTPEVVSWRDTFCQYLNDNRVLSVFSKYGEIEKSGQMGDYIRYILQDAKESFLEEETDFDINEYTKDEYKFITNGGNAVAMLLKKYL
jgi:hypothetical protein